MKLINKVDSVKRFKVYDESFYYCKHSQLYTEENRVLIEDVECQSFWQSDNIMFLHNNDAEYQLLNLKNGLIHRLNCSPYLFTLKKNEAYASYDYSYNIESNTFDWKIGVFNIYTGVLLHAIDNFDNCNFILQNDQILVGFNKDKYISGFSNIYNQELWNLSISNLKPFLKDDGDELQMELLSIIGVYKKVLWTLFTNRKIVGFDIERGILLHKIDLCKKFALAPNTTENFNLSVGDVHLDNENGIIKSLSYRYYWELDLQVLKIDIKKDFGEKSEESWRINRSTWCPRDGNLYFIGANKGEIVNRTVGIFDTEKLEVIWYDAPLEEKKYLFFTDVPQTNNKLLGVLDSEDNLWIYKGD